MKVNTIRVKKATRGREEMELIKVKRHFQLTIPAALREKLRLAVGDYVQADVENGKIVIRPVEVISAGKEKPEPWSVLDEIWAKMKDQDPQETNKLIDEAVKATRKKR